MPAHISITARLARDPEVKTSAKGTTVCRLTLPVDSGWGENKSTTWWTATLFGKRGEAAAQYLKKGSWVAVSGSAEVRTYSKKDGSTGFSAEVMVNDWSFVGNKEDSQASSTAPSYPSDAAVRNSTPAYKKGPSAGYSEADLPF